MKYIKLFMLLAVVAFMGSCSDDDESWNSKSGVTVSMENESMRFKESVGIVKVPIKVEGEANGPVSVTVEVKETGSNPAKENVHYYITTKTIKISDNTGNVELECVDDDKINDDRTFEISIVSAKGATVGSNATTAVTLRDNDTEFYEKLQGSWVMNCTFHDAPTKWDVKIVGATDENDKDYNKVLYITGMLGYQWTTAKLSYDFDKATGKGSVAFDYLGQYNFAEGVNFTGLGVCNVQLFNLDGKNLTDTPIYGSWSADFKTITFGEGTLFGAVIDSNGEVKGGWFDVKNITLTKK